MQPVALYSVWREGGGEITSKGCVLQEKEVGTAIFGGVIQLQLVMEP